MTNRPLSITAAAEECPDRAAIVTETSTITYRDLAERVRRVARWIGEQPGSRRGVAIVATLRPATIVALDALMELGIRAVLLHPRLTAPERAELVRTADVDLVLDEAWGEEQAFDASDGGAEALPLGREIETEAPLAMLFTSGTSGVSKGVVLSRRAFLASAAGSAENLGWLDDDRWLLCMPLAHVGGLSVIVRCLVARRTVVLAPWTGSVPALLGAIASCRATLLSLVPTMLRRILDDEPGYAFPAHVRAVLLGGDAASPALLRDAAARGVPARTTYGMTEACSQVTTQRPGEELSADAGRPLRGVELRVVAGEIQVRGPTLMSGYFPPERFPSPFLEGGWLPTGDLGEIDSAGKLHVHGRKSDLIITGGENVDPNEIERVLRGCPGVAETCAFGVADETWGQIVAAAIVPAGDLRLGDVARFVADSLAAHKRPRKVAIVEAISLNATNKVDRRATARACQARLVALPKP